MWCGNGGGAPDGRRRRIGVETAGISTSPASVRLLCMANPLPGTAVLVSHVKRRLTSGEHSWSLLATGNMPSGVFDVGFGVGARRGPCGGEHPSKAPGTGLAVRTVDRAVCCCDMVC